MLAPPLFFLEKKAIDLLLCALAILGVPLTLGVSRALQVQGLGFRV
jgi:hypothetical protein